MSEKIDDWNIHLDDMTVRQTSTGFSVPLFSILSDPEFQEFISHEIDKEILQELGII